LAGPSRQQTQSRRPPGRNSPALAVSAKSMSAVIACAECFFLMLPNTRICLFQSSADIAITPCARFDQTLIGDVCEDESLHPQEGPLHRRALRPSQLSSRRLEFVRLATFPLKIRGENSLD